MKWGIFDYFINLSHSEVETPKLFLKTRQKVYCELNPHCSAMVSSVKPNCFFCWRRLFDFSTRIPFTSSKKLFPNTALMDLERFFTEIPVAFDTMPSDRSGLVYDSEVIK